MKVTLKFRSGDILRGIRAGEYSVPDGCTVREALDCAIAENQMNLADHDRELLFPLVNNRLSQWENSLQDGDSVWVLFKILGG